MSFSGDGSEQSLQYLRVMPDVCRLDGEVAASHLHLDGIHSPSPSHFLSVYPFSFMILLTLQTQALWPALWYST